MDNNNKIDASQHFALIVFKFYSPWHTEHTEKQTDTVILATLGWNVMG